MSRIQLQPQLHDLKNWAALAFEQGLFFEPLAAFPFSDEECGQLAQTGLVSALHGAFIDVNPASGDAELRALSQKRCEDSCRLAKRLGADAVVFHSSCFPFLRGSYLAQWADCCGAYYSALAERWQLSVLIENAADVDPEPLAALMAHCSPQVGVCLDIGHANYSRCTPEVWFDALGSNIRHLHLSDNLGSFDDHLPLGRGTVDWKKIDALFRRAGTVERLTLEVGDTDGVRASLDYLRQNHLFGLE